MTFQVTEPPVNGVITGAPPMVTYMPNTDYFGSDSFAFMVNDGNGDTDTGTVTLTVVSINDPPVVSGDAYAATEGMLLDTVAVGLSGVLANDTDVEGDVLVASPVLNPSHGALQLASDGSFTYQPETGYVGPDSFTYQADDGTDTSVVAATVNIAVVSMADDLIGHWTFDEGSGTTVLRCFRQ